MEAPVRFFLPEGGVSALDAPGQPFHDPQANAALFGALEQTVRQTVGAAAHPRCPRTSTIPRSPRPLVEAFRALHGGRAPRRRAAR